MRLRRKDLGLKKHTVTVRDRIGDEGAALGPTAPSLELHMLFSYPFDGQVRVSGDL